MSAKIACRACGVKKPAREFYAHASSRSGRDGVCRKCRIRHIGARRHAYANGGGPAWAAAFLRVLKCSAGVTVKYDAAMTPDVMANIWVAQGGRCAVTGALMQLPPSHQLSRLGTWLRSLDVVDAPCMCVPTIVHPGGSIAPGNVMLITLLAASLYRKCHSISRVREVLKSANTAATTPPVPSRATLLDMPPPPASIDHAATIQ